MATSEKEYVHAIVNKSGKTIEWHISGNENWIPWKKFVTKLVYKDLPFPEPRVDREKGGPPIITFRGADATKFDEMVKHHNEISKTYKTFKWRACGLMRLEEWCILEEAEGEADKDSKMISRYPHLIPKKARMNWRLAL